MDNSLLTTDVAISFLSAFHPGDSHFLREDQHIQRRQSFRDVKNWWLFRRLSELAKGRLSSFFENYGLILLFHLCA
jgi:hypothetical protein